jgi:hypothetical protein
MGGRDFNFERDFELLQGCGRLGHDRQIRVTAHNDANQWLLRHLSIPP